MGFDSTPGSTIFQFDMPSGFVGLTAFFEPMDDNPEADPDGYALVESGTGLYQATIPDLTGDYRVTVRTANDAHIATFYFKDVLEVIGPYLGTETPTPNTAGIVVSQLERPGGLLETASLQATKAARLAAESHNLSALRCNIGSRATGVVQVRHPTTLEPQTPSSITATNLRVNAVVTDIEMTLDLLSPGRYLIRSDAVPEIVPGDVLSCEVTAAYPAMDPATVSLVWLAAQEGQGYVDGVDPTAVQRIIAASVAGELSGVESNLISIKSIDGETVAIRATVDHRGNRSNVEYFPEE